MSGWLAVIGWVLAVACALGWWGARNHAIRMRTLAEVTRNFAIAEQERMSGGLMEAKNLMATLRRPWPGGGMVDNAVDEWLEKWGDV